MGDSLSATDRVGGCSERLGGEVCGCLGASRSAAEVSEHIVNMAFVERSKGVCIGCLKQLRIGAIFTPVHTLCMPHQR